MPTVTVEVGPPPLGGSGVSATFELARATITASWGAAPATADLTYVRETVANETIRTGGITVGSELRITTSAGHLFWGVCKSDQSREGSGGKERLVGFADMREYLQWDQVFCAFNMLENRMVGTTENGLVVWRRRRRYWHITPANFVNMVRTYTNAPLTAAQILGFLFTAPPLMVRAGWGMLSHEGLALPVFGLDWTSGVRLDTAVSQLLEQIGMTFTHWGRTAVTGGVPSRWMLRAARRGWMETGDVFPLTGGTVFPLGADDCRDGYVLEDNPSHVMIVGERDRWQLKDVAVVPDWNAAWQAFFDPNFYLDYVFRNFWDPRDGTQTVFSERVDAGDPEQVIARQLALARAQELTVGEFAAKAGPQFADGRKYAGASRLGMPCLLYLSDILFRVFRLPDVLNLGATNVPTDSLAVRDELLVAMTHDPVSGVMAFDATTPVDGNGYAVVRGAQVGREFWERLSPSRFNVAEWLNQQDVWVATPFQWDQTGEGEGRRNVVFDAPVYRSADMWVESADGLVVPKAGAAFTTPPVRVAMVVEAGRYTYLSHRLYGEIGRAQVLNEPGLYSERLYGADVGVTVLPYEDGMTADQKSAAIAEKFLQLERLTRVGGFRRPVIDGVPAQQLNGRVNRVTLEWSGNGGLVEHVDFTSERGRDSFEPVRDYERRVWMRDVFPGQRELRAAARSSRVLAEGLRQTRSFLRTLNTAYYGGLAGGQSGSVPVNATTGTTPAGTPLYGPATVVGTSITGTRATNPSATTNADVNFYGISTRDGEELNQVAGVPVTVSGKALARVKGPAVVGSPLTRSNGNNYLVVAEEGATPCGVARQANNATTPKLIEVFLGGSAGGGGGAAVCVWQ